MAPNNILKVMVAGRETVVRFGLPAIFAAFAGAAALGYVAHFAPVYSYNIGTHTAVITPVKLSKSSLIAVFALFELYPALRSLRVDRRYLVLCGLLSGFFGGFSGHQSALRAACFIKISISPQTFVGTNALIGFLVDMARIATYGSIFLLAGSSPPLIMTSGP